MAELITQKLERKINDKTVRLFRCGNEELDSFIRSRALKQMEMSLSTCFVWMDNDQIVGYYTLSTYAVSRKELPHELIKGMPMYDSYPMILLGRMAVSREYQGKGNGEILLMDAYKRCYSVSSEIGAFALIVEPKNGVDKFYTQMGFSNLPDSNMLIIPIKTIEQLLKDEPEERQLG
jgi:GNAT superfamily N-acetyltransferase